MTITLILMHCQVIWDAGQVDYFSCFYHTHRYAGREKSFIILVPCSVCGLYCNEDHAIISAYN